MVFLSLAYALPIWFKNFAETRISAKSAALVWNYAAVSTTTMWILNYEAQIMYVTLTLTIVDTFFCVDILRSTMKTMQISSPKLSRGNTNLTVPIGMRSPILVRDPIFHI